MSISTWINSRVPNPHAYGGRVSQRIKNQDQGSIKNIERGRAAAQHQLATQLSLSLSQAKSHACMHVLTTSSPGRRIVGESAAPDGRGPRPRTFALVEAEGWGGWGRLESGESSFVVPVGCVEEGEIVGSGYG